MTGGAPPADDPELGPAPAVIGPAAQPESPDRSASPEDPGRDLVLAIHVVFATILAVAGLVLLWAPSPSSDPLPIAMFGVLAIAALIAVLVAIAVAGATGRHAPLAALDVMVTAPVLSVAPSSFAIGNTTSAPILLILVALVLSGLAGVIVATRVVREHDLERWLLGAVLALVVAFWLTVPIATLVPLLGLITLFGSRHDRVAVAPGPGQEAAGASPSRRGPPRSSSSDAAGVASGHGRGRAPDAAAVLAGRRRAPPSSGVSPSGALTGREPATGPDGTNSPDAPGERADPGGERAQPRRDRADPPS